MKKTKLRGWVKVALLVGVIILIGIIDNHITNDSIESCVKAGNSQYMCENGLK